MGFFRNRMTISASGRELLAFRDALRDARIRCRHQVLTDGRFHATIRSTQWFRLKQLANRYAVTVTVEKRQGFGIWLKPYRYRWGLLAGLVLGGWFCYHCNTTIRSIELYGNVRIPDAEVLVALEELGVTRGVAYAEIDFFEVERQMRLMVSDIEWIGIRHSGGRLVVELTEETQPPALVHDRIPTNYVATVPAQITGINVLGGVAVKQVGDAVKPGDILISGICEDARGVSLLYHADGIVTGIFETDYEMFHPFCKEIPVHGETVSERFLECFGTRFSLDPTFSPPTENFLYTETAEPMTLFGLQLPFTRIRCDYTHTTTTVTAFSEEEIALLQQEEQNRYEENFHKNNTILDRSYTETRSDLGISLKIHYVLEGVIGKTSEIFVK